ncbi:MAG: glycosyltransferase family A protein [Nitriliruptoraceae bacterium]
MTLQDDDTLARLITLDAPLGWLTKNDLADVLRDADRRIATADRQVETLMRRLSFASRLLLPWRDTPPILPHQSEPGLASSKARDVAARGYEPLRIARPRAFPELRVAHLGVTTRFATLAPHTPVTEATFETVLDASDLLLIEPPDDNPNFLASFAPLILAAAAQRHVQSVVVFSAAPKESVWHAATVVISETKGHSETIPLSIDTSVFNPVGYANVTPDPLVAISHTNTLPERLTTTEFTPRIVTPRGISHPDVDPLTIRTIGTPYGLRHALRQATVLADLPELRHRDPQAAARLMLAALACGIPVVTTDDTHQTLAPAGVFVTDMFADTVHQLVDDLDRRERASITARRQVLTDHSRLAAFTRLLEIVGYPLPTPPKVTVLLATNRPNFIDAALSRIANQNYSNVDVSLVLHGETFDDVETPNHPLIGAVTRVAQTFTLGSCLNTALDHASGTFVAKMDDDDHYGADHLQDLMLAHDYAKADIVGKQAEYVYLADRDVTIRRALGPSERRRQHVAGPTPLMRRELLLTHRFLPIPRRVDSTLYERVINAGGHVYATHARDFVLERRSSGHTWTVDDDVFRAEATETFDGLAINEAASTPR